MTKNRTKIISIFLISSCFLSLVTHAQSDQDKIIWSCKKPYKKENILWLVEWGDKSYIKVFDERIPATYKMDGLEKRWNWGLDRETFSYDYAITLSPDKTAAYYDFTTSTDGRAKSSAIYKCEK